MINEELITLAHNVGRLAVSRGVMLSTAESCTGGLLAAALTHAPGASCWFAHGFVCYSNASKEEMLHVSPQILNDFGAISEQTAAAMCQGAGKYSLAITGISGPDGSENKPVGMVCFGWQCGDITHTATKYFNQQKQHNREEIRQLAACFALSEIVNLL